MNDRVQVFTDGSCLGNPGPGGWAAILSYQGKEIELSGGFSQTTNNRMELRAVINALAHLPPNYGVDLFTDSTYIKNAVVKNWLSTWQKNGWQTAKKKPVKNQDLWRELLPLLENYDVRFHWVQSHAGHTGNERCDFLAKAQAKKTEQPRDKVVIV